MYLGDLLHQTKVIRYNRRWGFSSPQSEKHDGEVARIKTSDIIGATFRGEFHDRTEMSLLSLRIFLLEAKRS
jgi:hypothetical protein